VKQDKQDRRSQRTRQLVTSAMMELLAEKRYEAITIQDILDRAGIGRTTFYTHYFDKEDVHASMMEQMLERMTQELPTRHPGQAIVPSLELFRHIQQDHKHFQAIAGGPTAESLWETMQIALGKTIEQGLQSARKDKKQPTLPVNVVSAYLSGAFLSLLKWWLKSGMPYTPEEMDEIFRQLAMPGVEVALQPKNK
jgi:AcrR family transcriptional regulator